MTIATVWADKCATVAHLSMGTIHKLSAPSVPDAVRAEVVQRVLGSDPISDAEALALIAAAKPPKPAPAARTYSQPLAALQAALDACAPADADALADQLEAMASALRARALSLGAT